MAISQKRRKTMRVSSRIRSERCRYRLIEAQSFHQKPVFASGIWMFWGDWSARGAWGGEYIVQCCIGRKLLTCKETNMWQVMVNATLEERRSPRNGAASRIPRPVRRILCSVHIHHGSGHVFPRIFLEQVLDRAVALPTFLNVFDVPASC